MVGGSRLDRWTVTWSYETWILVSQRLRWYARRPRPTGRQTHSTFLSIRTNRNQARALALQTRDSLYTESPTGFAKWSTIHAVSKTMTLDGSRTPRHGHTPWLKRPYQYTLGDPPWTMAVKQNQDASPAFDRDQKGTPRSLMT
jgi:hypothetical protein